MKNLKRTVLSVVSVLFAAAAVAQTQLIEKVEPQEGKIVIPFEKYQLENGLTVILHEDHSDPIIHVDVTYHVGSNRETSGRSGFAHFFEHMMFQGSDHVADEEHFKTVQTAGGTMNGTTNRDRTNYFETLPANYLETALWLESDRMGFLLDAVTKEAFENQRATVKNEKGQNYLNQPYGTIREERDYKLYGHGHPYSWPTIGYTDDLDRADENDLKNFFLRWYGPNNASLTIAGDFDKEEAMALVEKYFGNIKPCPNPSPLSKKMPIVASDQYITIEDDIFLPMTMVTFPSVPNYHRDEPALDMLASIMGQGNNSIFYKNFVKSEKALQADVFNPCYELAGEFTIMVLAYPSFEADAMDQTEELIRKTIADFETEVLAGSDMDDRLARAKAVMKSDIIEGMQSIQGKASQLASWNYLLNRPFNVQDDLDRYDAVTVDDLKRVYTRYLKGKKGVYVRVVRKQLQPGEEFEKESFNPYAGETPKVDPKYANLKYVKAEDDFDRSIKPEPGESKPAVVPSFYSNKYDNGLAIMGAASPEVPKIAIRLTIKGGHLLDGDYSDGAAMLTAELMNEGTEKYTTEEISAELDRLGSDITFWAQSDYTGVYVSCMADQLVPTMKLLEEKLLHPRFDEEDFSRVKKQMLEGIKSQRSQAGLMAEKAFTNLMYGNSIMGSYYTGDYKSVDKLKLEDVKAFYSKNYVPNLTSVVVVGDVTKEQVMPTTDFMKAWAKKDVQFPKLDQFPTYEGPQVFLIDKPGSTQSQIRMGFLAHKYDATGIFFKSNMMNFSLGGSFNSRINLNLREDKGFTYGARSGFRGSEYAGVFGAGASVRGTATDSSIVEFMKEIEDFRKNGITEEELAFTKSALLLNDIRSYETAQQKARFLTNIMRYNLPEDYIDQQEAIVKGMTKADIDKLAQEQLRTENMVILVVGNSYKVKKSLNELGYGKVKELDVNDINLKEFKLQ